MIFNYNFSKENGKRRKSVENSLLYLKNEVDTMTDSVKTLLVVSTLCETLGTTSILCTAAG